MRPAIAALIAAAFVPVPAAAQEAITLAESFPAGYEHHVTTHVDLKGELLVPVEPDKPPKLVKMTGQSMIDYDERILPADAKAADFKSIRHYRSIDFRRMVGDRPQAISLRPEVRRLVVLKKDNHKVPFSPDGPLTWGEIDMLRTDLFVPSLAGLLPSKPVKPGDTWPVSDAAVAELTDMKIKRGSLTGKFELEETIGGQQAAHVTLSGELEGVNEDGPTRQKLTGRLYFDIQGKFISYLSINGEHFLLDKDGKVSGKIAGQFVMIRQLTPRNPKLTDAAQSLLKLEPDADNTLLLFDEPELGVKFIYPRRWHVGRVDVARGQITLDETNGSGMLLTVEALKKVPTPEAYMKETRAFLAKQKAEITRVKPPAQLQEAPAELEQFSFDADIGGQRVLMDYLIARQASAGATFAARIRDNDREALVKEVEAMARSLKLTRQFK